MALDFLGGLFTAPLAGPVNTVALVIILAALAVQLAPPDLGRRTYQFFARLDPTLQSSAVGLWLVAVAALGPQGVAPFIYFQF